jgi:hypothetical protein
VHFQLLRTRDCAPPRDDHRLRRRRQRLVRHLGGHRDVLTTVASVDSFDDVHVNQIGVNVALVFEEGTINLLNTNAGVIDASDFIF